MRSSKNKNPCFDCLASEKENEEVCKTIRAMLNKSNSVQVEMKDPGSIGTLTIGDCTYNVCKSDGMQYANSTKQGS